MLVLRKANSKDASEIQRFNQAMAWETEKKKLSPEVLSAGVEGFLQHPERGFYLVAEENSKVVGSLAITYEWSDWRNRNFWWIQSVYVDPEHRGKGIYRKLYDKVKALAQEEGNICGYRLYVEKENTSAQEVYRKLGMEESHYLMFEEMN